MYTLYTKTAQAGSGSVPKPGILYYDIFSNSFVTIADLGYNSYITDITEDANHTIWFASQGKGLISYDLKTSTLKFHSNDQTGLPQPIVCLCSDQGKLRIGTGGYGLYTYNPADHSFTLSSRSVISYPYHHTDDHLQL